MEQGSALGNDAAMNGMGAIYNEGDGVPRNVKVARQWFEKAAALGKKRSRIYGDGAVGNFHFNGFIRDARLWRAPQDEVSDPHGEERVFARLEP